jgi:hypothetical protein
MLQGITNILQNWHFFSKFVDYTGAYSADLVAYVGCFIGQRRIVLSFRHTRFTLFSLVITTKNQAFPALGIAITVMLC